MKKNFQILNGVALVATVIINYLSNTGVFNGETMATISAKYQNLFTPSGYAFSIWGLIYLGLFGFVIYFGPLTKQTEAKEKVVVNIGWWFAISCIANSFWVLAWLYEYTLLTIPIMVLLLVILFIIIQKFQSEFNTKNIQTTLFLRLPFYIYSGWISVALIADIAAYLKKIQWSGFGISETTWTIIMITIASLLHLFMIWKQKMPAFALVAVWALLAIAAANKEINHTVYRVAIYAAAFLLVNAIFRLVKRTPLNEN
ncbi:MAG: tryptophan-rich sensory protein [Bacteroidetes bacterium]|nr:tryptophan-rich sensory protein [Bacteroidota bacterium]